MSAPAPVALELEWAGELRFDGRAGTASLVLDSEGVAGPSPVQALAFALAGCMAMDVVHILKKGRAPLAGLSARLTAQRAQDHPRRLVAVALHFTVKGAVETDKVARAIDLSRQTYCSVWHSLRTDIDFRTSFEVVG